MEDHLVNIRRLPKNLFNTISRLIVDRLGINDQAFMRTLDIATHIEPHITYQISLIENSTTQNSRFCLVPQPNSPCPLKENYTPIPPRHVCINGHWDKEEYIKVTSANILGGMGTFTINNGDSIALPIIQACEHSLAFYNARLIAVGENVCFSSQNTLPLIHMDVGTTYEADYLMRPEHGHGTYLEYHNEPHFWMPLSPTCGGFVTLGREINGKYFLTGFKIPFGYAVYLSPYIIHSDAHLVGEHLVVYTLANDYSTVILKNRHGHLMPFCPIEADADLGNLQDCEALWRAARQGQLETLNALLAEERYQKLVAVSDNAALREAAFNGQLAIVERLLQFDSVLNDLTAIENGALALSSRNGHLAIVNRLLQFDVIRQNITAADNKALIWAAAHGHLAVVNRLLEFPAVQQTVAAADNEIFREAVKMNQITIVERLLQIDAVRANITAFDNEACKETVSRGHLSMLDLLLSFDVVVHSINNDCQHKELQWIIKNGHLPILERLLQLSCIQQHIADLDNEILRYAVNHGYLNIVYRLLELPIVQNNIAASSNEVLRVAAKQGYSDLVYRLLEFNAVQQQLTACDNEALRLAAKQGHLAIVDRLLSFPSVQQDVATCYNDAFQQAVAAGHADVIKRLLLCPEVLAFEEKYRFQHKFAEMA